MVTNAIVGILGVLGLVMQGYAWVLILALPGAPVFVWHLWLVSRREERRKAGIEILATGVLALAAPAAYWVGAGTLDVMGWWLLLLTWFQSAASIVYAYLRLEQRELPALPDIPTRLRFARRALLYSTFNLVVVSILSLARVLPVGLPIPYVLQWIETIYGSLHPAIGLKPTQIGVRQLIVSSLFTILFIISW